MPLCHQGITLTLSIDCLVLGPGVRRCRIAAAAYLARRRGTVYRRLCNPCTSQACCRARDVYPGGWKKRFQARPTLGTSNAVFLHETLSSSYTHGKYAHPPCCSAYNGTGETRPKCQGHILCFALESPLESFLGSTQARNLNPCRWNTKWL